MRPNTSNAPAREQETAQEIAAGRLAAGKNLFYLFGGTDAAGTQYDGILHQFQLAVLLAEPNWKGYLDRVHKDPHAKTLAIISASRNDPKFPPALVAELFSDPARGHDPKWFSEVFLAGAAEIHKATGKGLILPTHHSSFDLERTAYNLVDHLSEEARMALKLFMPEEAPQRELATTLAGILTEAERAVDEPGLTAAQRFYRWAIRSWEERTEAAKEKRRQRTAGGNEKGKGDPALILPPAPGGKPALPAPPQTAATSPAPPPAPVAVAPATPPAPTDTGDNGSIVLATFIQRLRATGAPKERRVDLVALFGKNKAEAIQTLQGMEAAAAD